MLKIINSKKMLIIDAIAAVVFVFLDQLTKYLTIRNLKGQSAKVLIDGVLEFVYLENRGSAFGMFQGQRLFILLIDAVFMAVVIFFLLKLPSDPKFMKVNVLMTMILAGGIGNMADRLRFGFVVDFISFVLINYPVFNVADIYIVVASFGLLILFMFCYTEEDLSFLEFHKKNEEDNNG